MRGGEVADFVTASLRVIPRRALDKGLHVPVSGAGTRAPGPLGPLALLREERLHPAERQPEAFGEALCYGLHPPAREECGAHCHPGAAVVLREFHRHSREREAVVWLAIFVNVGVAQLE